MITGDITCEAPIISTSASFEWAQRLDGTIYRLRLAWNPRTFDWSLDIVATDGTILASGLGVRTRINSIGDLNDARLPPGQIYVEADPLDGDPGRTSFASTHRLVYRPVANVATALGTDEEVR